MFGDSVKYGLQISRRATNNRKNVARRRLLLQSFGEITVPGLQFLEQPHVFDGNDGLVGEGLEEGDLLFRERTDLRAANQDRSNRNTLTEQWGGEYGASA